MAPIIEARDLWKRFTLHHERPQTLKEMLVQGWGKSETFWALKGLNFSAAAGEALGVVGSNGSGKSTLLKLLAGVLEPDRGQLAVRGRVSALLELGAGFHPDFTGRENVFLNGVMLGLTRRQVAARFDDIVGFAGLERFIDTPVKHYSSGMFMRLAFAVAVSADPEILLVDEVLAVGDAAFQRKCLEKIEEFKRAGTTLIFVSHDLTAVRRLCDRLVWLSAGEMQAEGETESTLNAYESAMAGPGPALAGGPRPVVRSGTREVEITGARWLDAAAEERHAFPATAPMALEIGYLAHQPVPEAVIGVAIWNERGGHCYGINTSQDGLALALPAGPGALVLHFDALPFFDGSYLLDVAVHDVFGHIFDSQSNCLTFRVLSQEPGMGVCSLPHRWEWLPGAARRPAP